MRSNTYALLGCLVLVFVVSCRASDPPADPRAEQPARTTPVAADSTPQPAEPPRLTVDGWGPLRIGMTRAEVVTAAGEDARPNAVGGPDPEACDEFRPARAPEGMLVMIEDGRLTRISISKRTDVASEHGFRVGDAAGDLKAALSDRATITPHKYESAPAEYVTIWSRAPSSPDPRGVVYEIGADGRVQRIHAGGRSIEYVEGCL